MNYDNWIIVATLCIITCLVVLIQYWETELTEATTPMERIDTMDWRTAQKFMLHCEGHTLTYVINGVYRMECIKP